MLRANKSGGGKILVLLSLCDKDQNFITIDIIAISFDLNIFLVVDKCGVEILNMTRFHGGESVISPIVRPGPHFNSFNSTGIFQRVLSMRTLRSRIIWLLNSRETRGITQQIVRRIIPDESFVSVSKSAFQIKRFLIKKGIRSDQ